MKTLRVSGLAATLSLALGCAVTAPVVPPPALIQNYQAPLDLDHQETSRGEKRGVSAVQNVLGIVSWGDASIRAAAEQGGITTIESADYEFFGVLGVYSRYTTVVYGD